MRISAFKSRFAKASLSSAIFGLLLFSSFSTVTCQTTTFAQFFEDDGSQDFVFTNNASSSTFNTVGGGSGIFFIYQNIVGLDPSLQGIQNARLFITTTTTQSGSSGGGTVTQPLNQTVTVQIIRNTAAPPGVGIGSRTNMLTAVFSPSTTSPGLVGSDGGNSANLSATTPDHVVTFTSDFLLFGITTQRNLAFSFSSVTPSIALGSGSFLQNLTAAASGTFASNPVPVPFVPTAAQVSVSGRILSANSRGVRNAQVFLTESNGTVRMARTGSFGYFDFTNIASGQTVIVSVFSKRYTFSSQVVLLFESAAELNFVADP